MNVSGSHDWSLECSSVIVMLEMPPPSGGAAQLPFDAAGRESQREPAGRHRP